MLVRRISATTMRCRRTILAILCAVATVGVVAPPATAATTIGDVTMASHNPAPATLGSPAFQGSTSGGYVISSPVTGPISSWEFRTAGADTGSMYELGVLAPVGGGAQNWRLVALSDAHAVTSAGGTDAVMGPFALAAPIAIAAGDRIALVPVGTGSVPIEEGVNKVDGIRYFAGPFTGGLGSSQKIVAGSTANNGQIVPVQATVGGSSPPPVQPPVNTSRPTITGVAAAGQALTCNPGTWTGSPTYTYSWSETGLVVIGVPGRRTRVHIVKVTTQFATSQTVTMPDYPHTTYVTCTVTATNSGGHASATSLGRFARVLRPVIALCRFLQKGLSCAPQITRGVGFGGSNVCAVGKWLHFPTVYHFRWVIADSRSASARGTIVARAPLIHIGAAEELKYLHCEVQAKNQAGSSKWTRSNTYFVPQLAPRPTGTSHIRIIFPAEPASRRIDPKTSQQHPLALDFRYRQEVACQPPQFNRQDAKITYQWEVTFGDGSAEFFDGQIMRIDTYKYPANITMLSEDGTQLLSKDDLNFTGHPVKVQCFTHATLSNSDTMVISPSVWLDTHFAPLGTPNPNPGL